MRNFSLRYSTAQIESLEFSHRNYLIVSMKYETKIKNLLNELRNNHFFFLLIFFY